MLCKTQHIDILHGAEELDLHRMQVLAAATYLELTQSAQIRFPHWQGD